jgi:hypothetical protein
MFGLWVHDPSPLKGERLGFVSNFKIVSYDYQFTPLDLAFLPPRSGRGQVQHANAAGVRGVPAYLPRSPLSFAKERGRG